MIRANLVNVLGPHLRLNTKHIVFGDDQHDRLARSDYTPDRVNTQLMHPTGLGCPNVHMAKLVLGGDLAFAQLGDLLLAPR